MLTFNRAAEAITGDHGGRGGRPARQRRAAAAARLRRPVRARARVGRRCREWSSGSLGRTDGTIEVGLSTAPLITPRGETGFLFTFQDVTDARKHEREARVQQRLAAVGEMAAGIAHEIRNPLASMSGSIQILRQELPLTGEQSQLMDIVLRESDRLNDTIRSFLAYARPQRLAATRVDVRQVMHRHGAAAARTTPSCSDAHAIDVDVPADRGAGTTPTRTRSGRSSGTWRPTALRAMPDGGELRLCVAQRERRARRRASWSSACEDQGVGIAPEELDGIFQPFRGGVRRRHRPRPRDRASHRQRLRRRGARHVRSAGVGTQRRGHAAARRADRDAPAGVELNMTTELQTTAPVTTPQAPARVLVVDDERSMRELLAIVLRREGYEVLLAENGARRARGARARARSTC